MDDHPPATAPGRPPLPVARLLLRSHNGKSPKDRHDSAYFAWEVSIRLAVAARPPADQSALARASIGQWTHAVVAPGRPLEDERLRELVTLLAEVGGFQRKRGAKVFARDLLGGIAAYRNRVLGHGAPRSAGFYEKAAASLHAGLLAAWEERLFLPAGAHLSFVESVLVEPSGGKRARVLDLSGDQARVLDTAGTEIPETVSASRVYLREADEWTDLHPWLLFFEGTAGEREAFYCFNGVGRVADYLDYESGESLRGKELDEAVPGLTERLRAFFQAPLPEGPLPAPPDDPNRFGDYSLLGRLGEGGMGEVYLARQESLGRLVALKMLPKARAEDLTTVARFRREIHALSRCEHPNVVKILASGRTAGTWYYAMEYVEGADLSQVAEALADSEDFEAAVSTASEGVRGEHEASFADVPDLPRHTPFARSGGNSHQQIARFFRDAALGVHHLHENGIVHRDLKPGNLMVSWPDQRAVVMDLGLAAVGSRTLSISHDSQGLLGTLRYMPPEQLQRNLVAVDHRADIYSLCAGLFEILTGAPFHDGDSEGRLIEQVLHERPRPLRRIRPGVPEDLATIVEKATEKDRRMRYDSALALADDLTAFLEGRPIAARPPTLGYLLRLALRRHAVAAAAVAATLLIALALTAYSFQRIRVERDKRAETVEDLLSLSVAEDLRRLLGEAEQLATRRYAPTEEYDDWLRRARAAEASLGEARYDEQFERLRVRADPWSSEQREKDFAGAVEDLEREIRMERSMLTGLERQIDSLAGLPGDPRRSELERLEATRRRRLRELEEERSRMTLQSISRATWSFASSEDGWWHRTLVTIGELSGRLYEPGTGWVSRINVLRDAARRSESATVMSDEAVEAWLSAIEAIADPARCPQYRKLRLAPQRGLVPVGQDPESRLWEFALEASGQIPARDEEGRLVLSEASAAVLVLIPGGDAVLGATRDPDHPRYDPEAQRGESPLVQVTLDPFFLGKHEITQNQWESLGGARPSTYGAGGRFGPVSVTGAHPVETVTWTQCDALLRAAGLTLPTEIRWEYAARAGSDDPRHPGIPLARFGEYENIADRSLEPLYRSLEWPFESEVLDGQVLHGPVDALLPNAFGLHGMLGNVNEWCLGPFLRAAHFLDADSSGRRLADSELRPIRGGCFRYTSTQARASFRGSGRENFLFPWTGVRAARSVED